MKKLDPFDSLDNVISDAKNYLLESVKRKKIIKELELLSIEIIPKLEKRKEEIKNLIISLPTEDEDLEMAQELDQAFKKSDFLIKNVKLLAEQAWSKENFEPRAFKEEERHLYKKHALKESMVILDGIKNVQVFYDLAEYVNRIWAEHQLFEEHARLEELVTALVRRMNETNLKRTATHLSKNVTTTLEHVRMNVFHTSRWNKRQISEYIEDRDIEILDKRPAPFKVALAVSVLMLGMSEDLINELKAVYHLDAKCDLTWQDLTKLTPETIKELAATHKLAVLITYLPQNQAILDIVADFNNEKLPTIVINSTDPHVIMSKLNGLLTLNKNNPTN
ncbi:MAG: hypothetical protein JJV97_05485 [SAR324 cluster bacterium]|nr:hypothetical protein [SAR324 cluster bacterium]